jgi:hypothetical protein
MTFDFRKSKEEVLRIVSELQVLGNDLGDLRDMKDEIATARAQDDVTKRNVKMAEQEFAECEAAYKKYAQMASEEAKKHEHLTAENKRLTDDNNKLSAERQRILQQFGG